MTFEELDERFPNGFDDAKVSQIVIDYGARVATFRLNLRGNVPDSPERDAYAEALLTLDGIYYISIEPPDPDRLSHPQTGTITVDGMVEDAGDFALFRHIKPTLPIGAFCCRFFVHDWNSFIHVAAAGAEFSWQPSK